MNKLTLNCTTGKSEVIPLTAEEVSQSELDQQLAEQQAQLNSLVPPLEEINQAEFELKTITLLQEVGLL